MSTVNDLWFSYLGELGYTGSINDRAHKALTDQTSETKFRAINQLWDLYLTSEGYTDGTLDDKMFSWLGDKGYTGSLSDRWYAALENDDVFTPEGPVLLCPYVMENDTFSSYTFVDGVAQGDTGATLLDTLTIAPDNGKIAIECELVSGTGVSATVSNGTDSAVMTADGSGTSATSGGLSTTDSVVASNGDRVGIIIDTDTGVVDYVNEQWHENFAEAVQVDVSEGAGFVLSGTGTVKAYTKAADMVLPYPAGTTDSCLNGGLRELVAYPMDADPTSAGMAPFDTQSLALQSGTFRATSAMAADAAMASLTQTIVFPGSGSVAWEAVIKATEAIPAGAPDGNAAYQVQGANVAKAATLATSLSASMFVENGGDQSVGVFNNSTITASAPITPGEEVRVGYLVVDSSTVRVWLNGVEQTLSDGTFDGAGQEHVFAHLVTKMVNADPALEVDCEARLITDPYWFTTPFPAGSRDINGNVFN